MNSSIGPYTGSTAPDVLPTINEDGDVQCLDQPECGYSINFPWDDGGELTVSCEVVSTGVGTVNSISVPFQYSDEDQYYYLNSENSSPGTWTCSDSAITLLNESSSAPGTCEVKIPGGYTGTSFTVTNHVTLMAWTYTFQLAS